MALLDKHIIEIQENFKYGSFLEKERDSLLYDAEKFKTLLETAGEYKKNLYMNCDISNAFEVFCINGKELMEDLERIKSEENKKLVEKAYNEYALGVDAICNEKMDAEVAQNMLIDGKSTNFIKRALEYSPSLANLTKIEKMLHAHQIVEQAVREPAVKASINHKLRR